MWSQSENNDTVGETLSTVDSTIRYDNDESNRESSSTNQNSVFGPINPLLDAVTTRIQQRPHKHASAYTVDTYNSFQPPSIGHTPQFSFLSKKKSAQTRTIDLDTDSVVEYIYGSDRKIPKSEKAPSKVGISFKSFLAALFAVTLLVGGAAVGAFLALSEADDSDSETGTGSGTNNENDFCSSFSTTDLEVREFLADNFDAAISTNSVVVNYNSIGIDISCLPAKAFDLLSDEQIVAFQNAITLQFGEAGIEEIAADAFDTPAVSNIQFLFLRDNLLTALPDNGFAPFSRLTQLILNENNFRTLDNNLFAVYNEVSQIFVEACQLLESFPEMVKFTPLISTIGVPNNVQMNEVNPEIFEDLTNLAEINIINSGFDVDGVGSAGFAAQAGLDTDVVTILANIP